MSTAYTKPYIHKYLTYYTKPIDKEMKFVMMKESIFIGGNSIVVADELIRYNSVRPHSFNNSLTPWQKRLA